jgi:hypothetical protein
MESATFFAILTLISGGFGAALKMMHSDMTKRAERAELALDTERKERAAERLALQATIDGYRDRTPQLIQLIEQVLAHTENGRVTQPIPQRSHGARIRPRSEARA